MSVDISFKNRSINFNQNHSKSNRQHQNSCNGKKTIGLRESFSRNYILKISLEKQPYV